MVRRGSRYRLLLLAPYCDGTDVGEAWSTYQWVSRLSEVADTTVLTLRKRNRTSVHEQVPLARVVEWPDYPLIKQVSRLNSSLKPGYIRFYARARRWIRTALSQGERFDVIHQISPLALRYPSPAVGIAAPLIIGPLGGSLPTPSAMDVTQDTSPWYKRLRGVDQWRLKYDGILRESYERAEVVLAVAPYVRDVLSAVQIKKIVFMSETGVVRLPEIAPGIERNRESKDVRCLFVGRLARMKGVLDAIRAIGRIGMERRITMDIVGEGEEHAACRDLISQLRLEDVVCLHGHVARHKVDEFYRAADVFVFPSYREPSGNVVLEAMSFGLPMVVADYGGPAFTVKDDFGIRVPIAGPDEYSVSIANAIESLASDPDRRRCMSDAGRKEVESRHLWEKKIDQLFRVYEEVVERRQPQANRVGRVDRRAAVHT